MDGKERDWAIARGIRRMEDFFSKGGWGKRFTGLEGERKNKNKNRGHREVDDAGEREQVISGRRSQRR